MHRRVRLAVATLIALLLAPVPQLGARDDAWELTPAGWAGGRVEHLRNLPLEGGSAIGAVRHSRYLYVTTARSFSIYDVKVPDDPRLLSTTALGAHALNEHPDTNGMILILSNDAGASRVLGVWDVRDKGAPRQVAAFTNPGTDHTWACVLDCLYAYGSHGTIVSLADPGDPARVGDWRDGLEPRPTRFHGIDQVAPGLVLVASEPTVLLDARQNPGDPSLLASVSPPVSVAGANRRSIPSYAHWPLEGAERLALETIETPFSGPCTAGSGGLVTYDTAGFEETREFRIADVYRITRNGTFADGYPPANATGCSAFGLAESPDWDAGDRIVAVAWLEHGVRVLEVSEEGAISEVGGFMAHGTEAAYPVWGSRRILYVADVARGLDVYRVGEGPSGE